MSSPATIAMGSTPKRPLQGKPNTAVLAHVSTAPQRPLPATPPRAPFTGNGCPVPKRLSKRWLQNPLVATIAAQSAPPSPRVQAMAALGLTTAAATAPVRTLLNPPPKQQAAASPKPSAVVVAHQSPSQRSANSAPNQQQKPNAAVVAAVAVSVTEQQKSPPPQLARTTVAAVSPSQARPLPSAPVPKQPSPKQQMLPTPQSPKPTTFQATAATSPAATNTATAKPTVAAVASPHPRAEQQQSPIKAPAAMASAAKAPASTAPTKQPPKPPAPVTAPTAATAPTPTPTAATAVVPPTSSPVAIPPRDFEAPLLTRSPGGTVSGEQTAAPDDLLASSPGKKKRIRRPRVVCTATTRAATAQGMRRIPKDLVAAPYDAISSVDLSSNRLVKFPEEILVFPCLEVLNLSCNRIPSVPESVLRLGRLKQLLIGVNVLTDLPKHLFSLPQLLEVRADHNSIATVDFPSETSCPIELLVVHHNSIAVIPESVSALRCLTILDANTNAVQTIPAGIGSLALLKELHLSDNRLTALHESMMNLDSLEILDVSGNSIKEIPPSWLQPDNMPAFASITEAYFQRNCLRELPEAFFSIFGPRIQLVDVAENRIEKLPSLATVPNLAALFVGGNRIKTLPRVLPTKVLACLDVSRNALEELPEFSSLPELQTIHAGYNPVKKPLSSLPPGIIELVLPSCGLRTLPPCDLPNLEILNLANNSLSSLPKSYVSHASLKVCDLSYNQLTAIPEGINDLDPNLDLHMEGNPMQLPERKLWSPEKCNKRIVVGVAETLGRRDTMEDFCAVHGDLLGDGTLDVVTVFDGHGGSLYSEAVGRHFPENFAAILQFTTGIKSIGEQLTDAFRATDEAAYNEVRQEVQGATALVGVFADDGRTLHVANAGDTRAVLCRAGEALRITRDHKALDPDEYVRVTETRGGFVTESGRVQGILAISRSLGDMLLQPVVLNEPTVNTVPLSDKDEFVIFACDGVWDVVTDSAAVRVVRESLAETHGNPDLAAIKLRDWAFLSGSGRFPTRPHVSCYHAPFNADSPCLSY